MADASLFVRSSRIDRIGAVYGANTHSRPSLHGYYRGNSVGSEATTTRVSFMLEDASAIELLRKSSIRFEILDISDRAVARFKARIRRAKQTPTLIVRNDHSERYEGVKAISEYVSRMTQ